MGSKYVVVAQEHLQWKRAAQCVELAITRDFVGIRDSKHPAGTALGLPHEAVAERSDAAAEFHQHAQ